jgi:signal transduction histidine kinase
VPVPAALVGVRGGEEFPLEASVSCLALDDGRSFTLIARDITERVRAEEALRSQAVSLANTSAELRATNDELQRRQLELERAMNARNRFYASMSHELRTPINAIIGYNTLLLDNIYGPLNERQVQGLQRTHKAAKHLLELVNDVLDLSKIEAGKIELSLQPVSFPVLIEDLFVTVRPLADEHGVELQLDNRDGQARTIVTDPRRVRQVLLNLLSNAIKFGRGKPICVEITTGVLDGVSIEVVDQGAGIKEADLARIFDEFVQLDQGAQGPVTAGTGLGLPISRRLATLLGGRLEVESHLGQGSRFRLILPPTPDGKPVPARGESAGRSTVTVDDSRAPSAASR